MSTLFIQFRIIVYDVSEWTQFFQQGGGGAKRGSEATQWAEGVCVGGGGGGGPLPR